MLFGLSIGLGGAAARLDPRSLFAAGEQGAWYDPADFSTMYQDAGGTTPVTAVGQAVGLLLDKRLGAARGAEQFSDGTVSFLGGASRVSPNVYRIFTADGTNTEVLTSPGTAVANTWYEVTFNIDSVTTPGAGLVVDFGGPTVAATVGPKRAVYQSNSNTFGIKRSGGITDIQVSGLSFRPLPGNHASQATAASRPVLSARYNKCTNSNANPVDLTGVAKAGDAAATLTLVNDAAALAAAGLDKICTLGNVYKLDNSTGVAKAYANFSGVTGDTNPHNVGAFVRGTGAGGVGVTTLGESATALTAAYQRTSWAQTTSVTSALQGYVVANPGAVVFFILNDLREASDAYLPTQVVRADGSYDTAGFPYYLSFDGVDDWLQTASVDFSATNTATVWCGATKISDAAAGLVLELGTSTGLAANPGSFSLGSSASNGTDRASWFAEARGSGGGIDGTQPQSQARPYAAPIGNVLRASYDLSQPTAAAEVVIAVNRGLAGSSQGTAAPGGNFGNYPLFIGRRGGTTLPFLGRLYGLVLRGAATNAATLAATENFIGSRMGLVF